MKRDTKSLNEGDERGTERERETERPEKLETSVRATLGGGWQRQGRGGVKKETKRRGEGRKERVYIREYEERRGGGDVYAVPEASRSSMARG